MRTLTFREEGASLIGAYIPVGLEPCIRYFLSCCDGVPNKSNVGKDWFVLAQDSRIEFIVAAGA